MKLLGRGESAQLLSGSQTLRDAVNEAFRDWMSSVDTTHFCVGSVIGPQLLSVRISARFPIDSSAAKPGHRA